MLGECAWTRNVRAADGVAVLRGRGFGSVRLVEIPVPDRPPVLRAYLDQVPGGRPHIPVAVGAPLGDFAAVAERYPIFRVDPSRR